MSVRVALRKQSSLEDLGLFSFGEFPKLGERIWIEDDPAAAFMVVEIDHIAHPRDAGAWRHVTTRAIIQAVEKPE